MIFNTPSNKLQSVKNAVDEEDVFYLLLLLMGACKSVYY